MQEITAVLLEWYKENKRDLPWRKDKDPYHVWISEIMLQQTRVEAVLGYYQRFLEVLPDISSLAAVDDDVLMKLWQGLGYYNRARNLKKAAQMIEEGYHGVFPESFEEIRKLSGIGEYTAGAIASISYGIRVPAADGNVYRIYTRLTEYAGDILKSKVQREIREKIAGFVPKEAPGDFNQALMDLGAGICLPNGEPLCKHCPLKDFCQAKKHGSVLKYPYKSPKKERRIEEKTILVFQYEEHYLLQKRAEKGLLAGLWEFPSADGNLSTEEVLTQVRDFCGEVGTLEPLGKAKHIFSHIEWRMVGYLVRLKSLETTLAGEFTLATKEELKDKYSIPNAYAAYLSQIIL